MDCDIKRVICLSTLIRPSENFREMIVANGLNFAKGGVVDIVSGCIGCKLFRSLDKSPDIANIGIVLVRSKKIGRCLWIIKPAKCGMWGASS